MKKEIKIGDWVNSYSKGIFRVERIIENYYEEADDPSIIGKHKIGDKQKDRTFITVSSPVFQTIQKYNFVLKFPVINLQEI